MSLDAVSRRLVPFTLCTLAMGFCTIARSADEVAPSETPATSSDAPTASNTVEHPRISTHLPHGRRIPHTSEAILSERVRLLTAELDLTEAQQSSVRMILIRQSDAIRKVWTDRTLTDGERGPITSAIGEKTADAIRDLLTPTQREKYNPPRPNTDKLRPEQAKDLSKWLDTFQQK